MLPPVDWLTPAWTVAGGAPPGRRVGSKNMRPRMNPRTRSLGRASRKTSSSDGADSAHSSGRLPLPRGGLGAQVEHAADLQRILGRRLVAGLALRPHAHDGVVARRLGRAGRRRLTRGDAGHRDRRWCLVDAGVSGVGLSSGFGSAGFGSSGFCSAGFGSCLLGLRRLAEDVLFAGARRVLGVDVRRRGERQRARHQPPEHPAHRDLLSSQALVNMFCSSGRRSTVLISTSVWLAFSTSSKMRISSG